MSPAAPRRPWYRILYVQVILAVVLGAALGHLAPGLGQSLKPLGDAFVRLVKLVVGPIVFCTVVHGIASIADLRRVGRVGLKALLYFELVSTLALLLGLGVANGLRPGDGMHARPDQVAKAEAEKGADFARRSHALTASEFLLDIIPANVVQPFAGENILQVLFLALLVALALGAMGPRAAPVLGAIEAASGLAFATMGRIVHLAPVGAFGAMAYTVGKTGLASLGPLLALMAAFYLTALLFVGVVLGTVARLAGFPLFRFLAHIREELLLVLGTSSSETALPGLMQKLQALGCRPATVGLVVPTGYSFNLDGTNIYLTMAALFLAQATDTPLSLGQQLALLGVAMVSSKGASGVTGAGFVVLAATLAVVPAIPSWSLALLLGIDRFMSECRALVNLVGNGVATLVVSRWEGEVTAADLRARLGRGGAGGKG